MPKSNPIYRKKMGQHFLTSPKIIHTIVETALATAREDGAKAVFEIGPGPGALTHPLFDALVKNRGSDTADFITPDFIAIEKDTRLALELTVALGHSGTVIEGDALTYSDRRPGPWVVVSNLPYSTGTRIALRWADIPEVRSMVLMFQREVAQKILAPEGSSARGSLSVFFQNEWEIRALCRVPPGSFAPPPKVESEVLVLKRRDEPRIPETARGKPGGASAMERFQKLLDRAFAQPRKMLRSTLGPTLKGSGADVDETLRPHQLSWQQWRTLFMNVSLILLAVVLLRPLAADASLGLTYGLGPKSSGLGGMTAALTPGSDPYLAFSNPGALGASDASARRRVDLGTSFVFLEHQFQGIQNVVVENAQNSDLSGSDTKSADVNTDVLPIVGQAVGMRASFGPDRSWSLGVSAFIPLERTSYSDTGEAWVPEYFLHRGRSQRPEVDLALSHVFKDRFQLGAGAHFGTSVTTRVSSFLATSGSKSSNMRVASSVKPKVSPFLGASALFPRGHVGAVVRLPLRERQTVVSSSKGEVFSGAGGPDVGFEATSTMHFEPLTAELGSSFEFLPGFSMMAQVNYERWSQFETPALNIMPGQSGIPIVGSTQPTPEFRDLWIPRVGFEWHRLPFSVRLGGGFRKSIVDGAPGSATNYIDPPRQWVSVGGGLEFSRLFGLEAEWSIDAFAHYTRLKTLTITKSEFEPTAVGSPGYKAGGSIFGGGAGLRILF